jgi:hypothetical protein
MTSMEQDAAEGSAWFMDPNAMFKIFSSVPYQPNILNTVMFLVKTAQQVSVLLVNYKGRPYMQGFLENSLLSLSGFICFAGLFVIASGAIPWV